MHQETHFAELHIRPVQAGIIIMTLITALFHLYLSTQPDSRLRFWFFLNFVGYVVLLMALYLPQIRIEKRWLRYALIAYTMLTIICWLLLARPYDPNDIPIKLIEVVLICLLLVEDRQVRTPALSANLPPKRSANIRRLDR